MEFIFGLASALCFGLADFLARFSTRRAGVYRTLLYMQCVGFLGVTLYLLVTGQVMHLDTKLQWQPWLWGVLAALTNIVSYLALYRAFAIGQLAVVAPIASGYAAVTVLLSVLSGEKLAIWQWVGIMAVLVGVVLAAMHKQEAPGDQQHEEKERSHLPAGVGAAIIAAFGLGFTFWLLGFAVTPVLGDALPIWLFRLVAICVMIPLTAGAGQSLALPHGRSLALVIGIGLLDTGAFIASTLGFATGQVAIVSVLSSLYSVVAVLLAWLFLKERLRPVQWTGIILLLIGITLTHL